MLNGPSAASIFNVQGTGAGTALSLLGGAGKDSFNIGASVNTLDAIQGPVSIDNASPLLPANGDTLVVNDTASTALENYTVTAGQISRSGAAPITYGSVATVALNAGSLADVINVQGISASIPVAIAAPGNDTVNLGSQAPAKGGVVDLIAGALTLTGSSTATLNIDDTGSAGPKTGTLTRHEPHRLEHGQGHHLFRLRHHESQPCAGGGSTATALGNNLTISVAAGTNLPAVTHVDGGTSHNDTLTVKFLGDLNGSLTDTTFEKGAVSVGGNLNGSLSAGGLSTVAVTGNVSGTVNVGGSLGAMSIGGQFAVTGSILASNLNTLSIGTAALALGHNLAGTLNIANNLGSVTVAGGTPGLIIAGHVGTVAAYGGYGPEVLRVIENSIERHLELATPANPYPAANPAATVSATTPYVNVQYVYEDGTAAAPGSFAAPQLTARIKNPIVGRDQFDVSLITYSDTAKFNLARLDSTGTANVRNIDVEGDLLTTITATAAAFLPATAGTVGGIRLPLDKVAGVGIRDHAPNADIAAGSLEAIAFGSYSPTAAQTLAGSTATAANAAALIAAGTVLATANDTFRVPFADMAQNHVGFFLVTAAAGGKFDGNNLTFAVQGVTTANPAATANIVTASNVARGAATALITAAPAVAGSAATISGIAIRGDGASLTTLQPISGTITSTGPLGDLNFAATNVPGITAPSIFGSILGGTITGTIQTTGLRTDPITGAVSPVPADIGSVYLVTPSAVGPYLAGNPAAPSYPTGGSANSPYLTTTVIQGHGPGGMTGKIISRGNLVSWFSLTGAITPTGLLAVQGNLGAPALVGGNPVNLGGINMVGPMCGQIIVLGNVLANSTFQGGFVGGRMAVKGSVFGNLEIDGTINAAAALVVGGTVGSVPAATVLKVANLAGIFAAEGAVNADPPIVPAAGAFYGVNLGPVDPSSSALNPIFSDTTFDATANLDLANLVAIQAVLAALKIQGGVLVNH